MRPAAIACCLCSVIGLQAQNDSLVFPERKNVIKLGVSSGILSTISLNYERVLNDELSVAFTASYMLPHRASGFLDLQTENLDLTSGREISGWFLTPEVKWYLEKSDVRPAPRGFYLCAYARLSDLRLTAGFEGVTDTSGTIKGDLQVDLIEAGLGVGAGYQLLMAHDRVAIDFIFFGPRYSLYTVKVDAELQGDQQLIDDLGQSLEQALGRDIVPFDIELEKTGTTSTSSNGLGYRLGFKVGYAF